MVAVNVFKAVPGMVLAQDVKNRDGRHLMDAGTLLQDKEIRILRMWGILEIHVKEGPEAADLADETSGEILSYLNRRFRDSSLSEPVVRVVYDLCAEFFEAHPGIFAAARAQLQDTMARKKEKPVPGVSACPEELLTDTVKLPALPQIYSEINAAVNDPRCSGKEIAEIVSKDTGLSATLLKIVNSAYYGFSEKVDSLSYAAMALGTQQICALALGITVVNYFKGLPGKKLDMKAFWQHSLGCAIMAKNLATHVDGVDGERVFIGGLLHDMGRLIYLSQFPDAAGAAMIQAARLNLPLNRVEPQYFKLSHSEFGSRLADLWNLSDKISALIRNHHGDSGGDIDREAAVVYVANWIISALGIGYSGETALVKFNLKTWNSLEISPAALAPVIRQTNRQLREAIRFFYE